MKVSGKCALLAMSILLCGCAGPSTRVLPRVAEETLGFDMPQETSVLEEVNPFYLQEELNILSAMPRPCGSLGEISAADYIENLLNSYGYQVERYTFHNQVGEEAVAGSNIVAIRPADTKEVDSDVLIIMTHHDSPKGTLGANNNASGTAAFLETARLLSMLPTDTELRLVSTAEYGEERLGSAAYLKSLTKTDTERILGIINLEQMGHVSLDKISLKTLDGNATMLSEMLADAAQELLEESWPVNQSDATVEALYAYHGIPLVTVSQEGYSYESGTPLDEVQTVDIDRLSQVVDAVSRTAFQIMNYDTPSMTAKAHSMTDLRRYGFWQRKGKDLLWGEAIEAVEKKVGMKSVPTAQNMDSTGKEIKKYPFLMKWFGVDQLIVTDYYFVDGKLNNIVLEASEAGIDFADMRERLTGWYDNPMEIMDQGPNGIGYVWLDKVNKNSFTLLPVVDGYTLEIREYFMEKTVYQRRAPQGELIEEVVSGEDIRCAEFMRMFQMIFPENIYDQIQQVQLFSDGLGGAVIELEQLEDNSYILSADLEDTLGDYNSTVQKAKTCQELLEYYGEIMGKEGYEIAYQEQFITSQKNQDIQATELAEDDNNAEVRAPGETSVNDNPPPMFRQSFALFVLCEAPPTEEAGLWGDCINFFYNYEELVSYRENVRAKLQ